MKRVKIFHESSDDGAKVAHPTIVMPIVDESGFKILKNSHVRAQLVSCNKRNESKVMKKFSMYEARKQVGTDIPARFCAYPAKFHSPSPGAGDEAR